MHGSTMKAPDILRSGQSLISFPRHGYCDVFLVEKYLESSRFWAIWRALRYHARRRLRVTGSTRTFNIRSSHWLIPNTAHAQSGDNLRLGRAISFSQNIDIRSSKLCVQLTVDFYEGRSSQLYTHLLWFRKESLKNIFGGHATAR